MIDNQVLNDLWKHIEKSCDDDNRYLRKIWYHAWNNHVGGSNNWQRKVEFLPVSVDGSAAAVIPYSIQSSGPFQFVSVAGNYFPNRGIPFTGHPKAAALAVVEGLTKKVKNSGFRVGPIATDADFSCELIKCLRLKKWKVETHHVGQNFLLPLPDTAEEFLSKLTTKRKNKMRNYWNSLQRQGDVYIKHFNNLDVASWRELFIQLADIESDAWISQRGEPNFKGKNNQLFWNQLITDDWFKHSINVWMITLDDKAVSYVLSIDTDETRHVLSNSYVEQVANYRTGTKLYLELILQAILMNKKQINFGMGDSGYKSQWGAVGSDSQSDLFAFPPTMIGRLSYLFYKLKNKLQTVN